MPRSQRPTPADRRIVGGSLAWSLAFHLLGGGAVLALPLLWPAALDEIVLAGRRGVVEIQAAWAVEIPPALVVEIPLTQPVVEVTPTAARIEQRRFTVVESPPELPPTDAAPQDRPANATPDPAIRERTQHHAPALEGAAANRQQPPRPVSPAPPPASSAAAANPEVSGVQTEQPASLADNPPPIFPLVAAQNGWHGTVLLRVAIAASGQVGDVRIERSSGYDVLDAAAVQAVRRWRARPKRRGHVAVDTEELLPIVFLERS